MDLLKRLCDIPGIAGDERLVRDLICEELARIGLAGDTDPMGNLIVTKPARNAEACVMLAAHMDEVGFMITSVDDAGLLQFKIVGNMDPRILPGKRVQVGRDRISGVIGAKPVHLQSPDEQKSALKVKDLRIDIGAVSSRQVGHWVHPGDSASFLAEVLPMGKELLQGKAFDDRCGCALLLGLLADCRLRSIDLVAVFTVQEEVGLRGSAVAARRVTPDAALVLECTAAGDSPDVKVHLQSTCLGKGPALTLMDRSVICDRTLVERLVEVASDSGIPYQMKRSGRGGTDAGALAVSGSGIRSAVISVPGRYIHSPVSVVSRSDMESTGQLLREFLRDVDERGIPK